MISNEKSRRRKIQKDNIEKESKGTIKLQTRDKKML